MIRRHLNFILCLLMTAVGGAFLLWYIKAAGCDVVYSDYIRIVNEYLPDVTDPSRFFVPDVLTRIPATYLSRLINVKLFSYSVTFDRVCSAVGLCACAFVIALYMKKERFSAVWFIPAAIVIFSLNKWEVILNGTAWAHTVAFALFFLNYYILDRRMTDPKRHLDVLLIVLPFLILLFAGEYIASYAAVMTAAYIYLSIRHRRDKTELKAYMGGLSATLISLFLYLLSRHFAVWEHAGATDMSFLEFFSEDPLFIVRFLLKSLAGSVLGQQAINDLFGTAEPFSDIAVFAVGIVALGLYSYALVLQFKGRLWDTSMVPMLLLLSGALNHILIAAARWIFLNDGYGLSSRYGVQFMVGIIGVILTFAFYLKKMGGCRVMKSLTIVSLAIILAGQIRTNSAELAIVPYREQNYEHMREVLLNYEDYDEEELCSTLEWRKSPDTLYNVIHILEENKLNVFRN